ncbi:MAG: alpha/beta fold hydrolase, partial [Mycobacterium sp.]
HVPRIPELAAGLDEIRCPTAIIWGDRDPYIPFETARELADRIPNATLTCLRGGDHYIMEERPDEVTSALLDLLARNAAAHPRLA